MNVLQFILFKNCGALNHEGEMHVIPKNHIVVADESVFSIEKNSDDFVFVTCYPINLLPLYQDLISQAAEALPFKPFMRGIYKTFPIGDSIIESTEKLMAMEKNFPACFLYLYCLGIDKIFFSSLLYQFIGFNLHNTLLDFFEENYVNQWAVSRYAKELGITTHKLNVIFHQKYGMPVKQWLMEKRLKKGGELLLATSMRVADIAKECGFSNHAHFTSLFRRRFQICPSLFRAALKQVCSGYDSNLTNM
ncbi:helix-turn-helix domain-containing protein [Acerihabitans arboris]|uniref:Helix-turn-helix domain-containing protein n=1 Tax=Acerihabitans arboris TaxID=2691583 RepID=A0A845SKY3_9GAMM|nr:helix-turn-helix domain-containing protein [Acerihabitans arboris]NDL61965.1 helix-turn-helix domain-containing protein [Acerihabitans arboris]